METEPASEDSKVVSDLTQIFIPSEEDRTGRGQQNSRLLQLVECMESEGGKERRAEGWISQESRRLLAAKSAALHNNKPDLVRSYGKALRRQLQRDRKERIRRVSEEVEERLVAKDVIGAYELLRPWYKSFDGKATTPSEDSLEKVRKSYEELFTKDDNLGTGLPFQFQYDGPKVLDEVPSDAELGIALGRMKCRKAPGLTGLKVDTLKMWYRGAFPERREVIPDPECVKNWTLVR